MAVDIEEAMRRAVLKFYEGNAFENFEKASGEKVRYNKEYFDEFEKGMRTPKGKKKLDKEVPEEDGLEMEEVEEADTDA